MMQYGINKNYLLDSTTNNSIPQHIHTQSDLPGGAPDEGLSVRCLLIEMITGISTA